MGEVVYQYDQTQDLSTKPDLTLSCICGEDSFSYAIEAGSSHALVAARVMTFDKKYPGFRKPLGYLPEVIREDSILFQPFTHQTIAVRGIPFVIVEHVEGDGRGQLSQVAPVGPNDALIRERLPHDWGVLISSVPVALVEEVSYYFMNASLRHAIGGLIRHASDHASHAGCRIAVNLCCSWFEVIVTDGDDLRLANHYKWSDISDVLYYLSAIQENYRLHHPEYRFTGALATDQHLEYLEHHLSLAKGSGILGDQDRLMDLMTLAECV